jgi:ubiquinone/menaquinone biosynthesis C-methylase UbiE
MNDWRSYDDVADVWEQVHAPRNAEIARDLIELGDIGSAHRVLDVGTGTGVLAEAAIGALGEGGTVVGVDVSLPMLALARRARPDVPFAAAEAINLPFRDRTFELVAGNFVLHHFARYETALFDLLRVLRPGGRIALSTWGKGEDDLEKTWRELVEQVVGRELFRDAVQRSAPWRERFGDREKLEETLLAAGLRKIRTESREYRFAFQVDEYVAGRSVLATGRFVKEMLGAERFEAFCSQARQVYRERFADPLNDFRDVWLAVGTKP